MKKTKATKTYICYIKSHSEAPDFEREVEAKNKKEAIDYFLKLLGPEWDASMIKENCQCLPNCH